MTDFRETVSKDEFQRLQMYQQRFLPKEERKITTIADVDHANTEIETDFDANE